MTSQSLYKDLYRFIVHNNQKEEYNVDMQAKILAALEFCKMEFIHRKPKGWK